MAVKMILLKTGETLITDAQEVVQEEKGKRLSFQTTSDYSYSRKNYAYGRG